MATGTTLTTIMQNFQGVFTSGVGSLLPIASGLLATTGGIDLIWSTLTALIDDQKNMLSLLFKKIVKYGLWIYIVTNYQYLMNTTLDGFIKVGLIAGGNSITAASMTDPSSLIELGIYIVSPLQMFIKNTSTLSAMISGGILISVISYFLIILCFFIMAWQVFITFLEFYCIGTLALIFIPFAVLKQTSFLAEKAIGAVISFGIKIMTLSFILSAALPLLKTWALPAGDPGADDLMRLLGGAFAIALLCWQAPSLAAGLMAGSPSLSAGVFAGAGVAGMTMLTMGASAGKGVVSNLAGLAGGNAQAGLNAVRAGAEALGTVSRASGKPPSMSDVPTSPASGTQKSASDLASRLALAERAVPQEASPSGGLQVPIHYDE